MVSRQEKMANVLYFNKNHVCLIIIAKMMQQTAEALSVSGRFHVIFMAASPGGLGENAVTPLQNPIRSRLKFVL